METTDQVLTEEQAMDALEVSEEIETEAEEVPVEEQPETDEEPIEEEDDGDDDDNLEEADDDAEEDDETDDEPDEEQDADSELHDVIIDGETEKWTLQELKNSASGQAKIRKGIEENATVRKELDRQIDAFIEQRNKFAHFVQNAQQQGVLPQPTPPDPKKFDADPFGYMEDRIEYETQIEAYQQQQQALQEQQAYQQQIEQQRAQEADRRLQEHREAQKAKLIEVIPEFGDPKKAARIISDIVALGADYGVAPEEFNDIRDARTIMALYDLMQLKKSKGKVAEKVAKARPVAKPGSANKTASRAKKRKDLMSKLKETGSDDYALRLLDE